MPLSVSAVPVMGDVRTPVPRAQLNGTPPPPPGSTSHELFPCPAHGQFWRHAKPAGEPNPAVFACNDQQGYVGHGNTHRLRASAPPFLSQGHPRVTFCSVHLNPPHTHGAHLLQPSSEAYEAEDRFFRVSVAKRLMLPRSNATDVVQSCPQQKRSWPHLQQTSGQVMTAGLQQWPDVSQTIH